MVLPSNGRAFYLKRAGDTKVANKGIDPSIVCRNTMLCFATFKSCAYANNAS